MSVDQAELRSALPELPVEERRSVFRDGWRELKLAATGYRHLVRYLVSASLRTENTGTFFGYLWWLLDPLLLMAVYVVLVDVVLDRGRENFALFVLAAVLSWKLFQAGCRNAMSDTIAKERQMRQVAFPKVVIPFASIAGESLHFAFGLAVFVAIAIPFGIYPHPAVLYVVPVAVVQVILTLGVAYFLSAANVFFRDVQHATQHVMRLGFYLSPSLYAVSDVPERFRDLYELNPFATIIPAYRDALLEHTTPDFAALGVVAAVSVAVLAVGYLFFVRLEPWFAKVN